MGYIMKFQVDGACRGNGKPGAIAAAAACLLTRGSTYYTRTRALPSNPVPNNARAEIQALVIALEWVLEKYDQLDTSPYMDVTIQTDSQYAIDCMTKHIDKWRNNGWYTVAGTRVKHRDLIQQACQLEDEIEEIGHVTYEWIPRGNNQEADAECNQVLDNWEYDDSDDDSQYY
ncbi:hypothetical protein AA313_de0206288 [Arthrobotrys entomopaga]|nr:hypothetical protein AA313_de0206288 [Arthrobotrys entomopaga]